MGRNKERHNSFNYQDLAWNSPQEVAGMSFALSEPETRVDETTLDVLSIFSEGQQLASNHTSRFHLFDEKYPHIAPHLPKEMIEDDFSEESWP